MIPKVRSGHLQNRTLGTRMTIKSMIPGRRIRKAGTGTQPHAIYDVRVSTKTRGRPTSLMTGSRAGRCLQRAVQGLRGGRATGHSRGPPDRCPFPDPGPVQLEAALVMTAFAYKQNILVILTAEKAPVGVSAGYSDDFLRTCVTCMHFSASRGSPSSECFIQFS